MATIESINSNADETLEIKYLEDNSSKTVEQVNPGDIVYVFNYDESKPFNKVRSKDGELGYLSTDIIKKHNVDYDWVVIDECHGLFSEASFAEDTTIIGDWIKNKRGNTHIIFITANDEYFEELSKQFFSDESSFIYLFPDFTKYVSNTYVKEIQFIKTKNTNLTLDYFLEQLENKKGIIFLKSASKVKDWYFKLLDQKKNVAMLVSRANQTALSLDIN